MTATRGRRFNAQVLRDVPWARPLDLPEGDDVRSLLQRHGSDALLDLLLAADGVARLDAAFMAAETLDECHALLAGEGVIRRAA